MSRAIPDMHIISSSIIVYSIIIFSLYIVMYSVTYIIDSIDNNLLFFIFKFVRADERLSPKTRINK